MNVLKEMQNFKKSLNGNMQKYLVIHIGQSYKKTAKKPEVPL